MLPRVPIMTLIKWAKTYRVAKTQPRGRVTGCEAADLDRSENLSRMHFDIILIGGR